MGMGNTDFVLPVGGGGGFFGGGNGLSAFAGAALGSLFFNGGGFGWGGNGRGGCGGSCGGSGPIIVNGGDSGRGHCSTAELDALSGIQTSINGLGLAVVQGQNASNLAACQGFSGVTAANAANTAQLQNSMNQGFAGLNTVIQGGDFGIQQSLCQGFGGLNTSILSSAKDAALQDCRSTGQIVQAISDCCCKTQSAIHAEGEATRGLMSQLDRERLLRESSAKDAKIAALESQAFIAASQTAQNAAFQQAINQQSAQFARVLGAYRLGRIDERDGTAADGGAAA